MAFFVSVVFWVALGVTAYNYLLYPCLLLFLSRLRKRYPVRDDNGDDNETNGLLVSVILPTRHDEKSILDRLQNLLESDYPADCLEIVVGCGAQEDLTRDLVATVNDPRVRVVQYPGQPAGNDLFNECLAQARGEIIVLTDCEVKFERQTLRRLARHFRSPHIGAVCGRLDTVISDGSDNGMHDDVYDSVIAEETTFGIAPHVGSRVAAFRADLLRPLPRQVNDAALYFGVSVYRTGLAIVLDLDAAARVRTSVSHVSEQHDPFWRRFWCHVKSSAAIITAAGATPAVFVLLSHLLRQRAGLFLVIAMMGNAILASDPFYLKLLLLHELIWLAVLAWLCFRNVKYWPWQRETFSEQGS